MKICRFRLWEVFTEIEAPEGVVVMVMPENAEVTEDYCKRCQYYENGCIFQMTEDEYIKYLIDEMKKKTKAGLRVELHTNSSYWENKLKDFFSEIGENNVRNRKDNR